LRLERPIRDALASLQHGHRAIEDLFERHGVSGNASLGRAPAAAHEVVGLWRPSPAGSTSNLGALPMGQSAAFMDNGAQRRFIALLQVIRTSRTPGLYATCRNVVEPLPAALWTCAAIAGSGSSVSRAV